MVAINPIINKMPRSGIRVILDEANKLRDVIHLEIGQPDFKTPDHIIEAAYKAAFDGFTGYTPNAGYDSLREAFAKKIEEEQKIRISPNQVVVTGGAMGALFDAFGVLLSSDSEVLIPDPGYPNYSMSINLFNAEAVPYSLGVNSSGFYIDIDKVESLITNRTRAIVLNSPSNPTGMIADSGSILQIIELAKKNNLWVVSDEAYDHIVFNGSHISPLQFDPNGNVVSIYSCSKTYAMTGWRVGFVIAPENICKQMSKLQEAYISCAPSISQKAAEAAIKGPQDCVKQMNDSYKERRDFAIGICEKLSIGYIKPAGAFYLLVSLPDFKRPDSMKFALELVKDHKLAVAPGITFGKGGDGFIRIALCASKDNLEVGLNRLSSVFESMKE